MQFAYTCITNEFKSIWIVQYLQLIFQDSVAPGGILFSPQPSRPSKVPSVRRVFRPPNRPCEGTRIKSWKRVICLLFSEKQQFTRKSLNGQKIIKTGFLEVVKSTGDLFFAHAHYLVASTGCSYSFGCFLSTEMTSPVPRFSCLWNMVALPGPLDFHQFSWKVLHVT